MLRSESKPYRDIPKFIKLDKKKIINLEKVIQVINFKNINMGIKMFQSNYSTGRIIVKF